MNTKLLFAQLLISIVHGQELGKNDITYPPTYLEVAAKAGLAPPTSAWNGALEEPNDSVIPNQPKYTSTNSTSSASLVTSASHYATSSLETPVISSKVKETSSIELATPTATKPALNLLNNAAEGDIHGANPRNNLVYFGVGRHGFGFGAECNGDCCGDNCDDNVSCHEHHHEHQHERPCHHPPPPPPNHHHNYRDDCGPEQQQQPQRQKPYLKVTPSQVVQTFTRTYVQTGTSTSYDVSSSLRTRTITDEVYATKTNIVNPERTYTYVDKHTIFEYPASTIDASQIRGAYPTQVHPDPRRAPC